MESEKINKKARIKVAQIMSDVNVALLMEELMNYDNITYEHCLNVAYIVAQIMIKKKEPTKKTDEIVRGALLHDIGKLNIPKEILNKRESLTESEFAKIKKHTIEGIGVLETKTPSLISPIVQQIVLYHHEKPLGDGYPYGITNLSKYVRLVSTVDAYEAMTAKRSYGIRYSSDYSITTLKIQDYDNETIYMLLGCEEK